MSSLLDPLMGPSKDLGLRNQLMKKKKTYHEKKTKEKKTWNWIFNLRDLRYFLTDLPLVLQKSGRVHHVYYSNLKNNKVKKQ